MKRAIVLAAALAALVVLPATVSAQGAFPTYRQAAADQYGGPPGRPPGRSGDHGPPPGRPPGKGQPRGAEAEGEVLADRAAGGAPIRVAGAGASATRDLPRGSLPFTGGDLTVVVLAAAGLLAAGALAAAAARVARRRRAL
jgi:hypothetical protein